MGHGCDEVEIVAGCTRRQIWMSLQNSAQTLHHRTKRWTFAGARLRSANTPRATADLICCNHSTLALVKAVGPPNERPLVGREIGAREIGADRRQTEHARDRSLGPPPIAAHAAMLDCLLLLFLRPFPQKGVRAWRHVARSEVLTALGCDLSTKSRSQPATADTGKRGKTSQLLLVGAARQRASVFSSPARAACSCRARWPQWRGKLRSWPGLNSALRKEPSSTHGALESLHVLIPGHLAVSHRFKPI